MEIDDNEILGSIDLSFRESLIMSLALQFIHHRATEAGYMTDVDNGAISSLHKKLNLLRKKYMDGRGLDNQT